MLVSLGSPPLLCIPSEPLLKGDNGSPPGIAVIDSTYIHSRLAPLVLSGVRLPSPSLSLYGGPNTSLALSISFYFLLLFPGMSFFLNVLFLVGSGGGEG